MPLPEGRFSVAFGADSLVWDPVWVVLDDLYPNLVTSYTIDRGRQYELDRTDTGRATVELADTLGVLDPTNASGPYHTHIQPLKQAIIRRWNPVAEEWDTRFRGFIEDIDYALDPSQHVYRLTVTLVDLFEILSAAEMVAGTQGGSIPWGHDPSDPLSEITDPEEMNGQVWFGPTAGGQPIQDRLVAILADAGIPDGFQAIFSGNVDVQDTVYSPGETALSAIQETADAEFPGVANVYCTRHGELAFHGRVAKFDPAAVLAGPSGDLWDFHEWKGGDGGWVASSPADFAHIREFAFNRGLSKIINYASATPMNIADADVADQLYKDDASKDDYGIRSWSAQNLLTKRSRIDDSDALVETKRFAEYYVENYAQPQNRITTVTFRSVAPGTPGASENWRLLSKVDISDSIEISVDAPSGGGFIADPYFVEGVHEQCRPANPGYDDVTVSLDLSPRAYFTGGNPWEGLGE